MPQRNPFAVLGLPHDASMDAIKAAWRRLARRYHPDLTSRDQALERRSTRLMVEINAAYEELRDPVLRRRHRETAARATRGGGSGSPYPGTEEPPDGDRPGSGRRHGWVGEPRPSRPVTARIDTSALFRPRNATLVAHDRSPLPGLPPRRRVAEERAPLRASDPSGPLHRRPGPSLEADLPSLAAAMETRLEFGKFEGSTLGDVASLEPSYVDWIVRTISRNPELLLAARVVLRYLERSGAIRRQRLDTAVPRH
jgi:curved DNA-binding protein CbpA